MSVQAEIITIGDEILYGQTLDTNSHWISSALDQIHIKVLHRTVIGDERSQILKAFKEASERTEIIFITGGLGPTKDDLTKPLLAEYFNVELKHNKEALTHIEKLFKSAGREMTALNRQQADLPENCQMIPNRLGTAPGMWFESKGKIYISMPGVPYEMENMMTEEIIPKLKSLFLKGIIHHKIIKTIGIPESKLAHLLTDWEDNLPSDCKLAYLPSLGQVKLRLTVMGDEANLVEETVNNQIAALPASIHKYIYGYDQDEIENVIGKMLLRNQQTMGTAESCTGGYLAHKITSIPGSSRYFKGSIIAYSNEVKINELNVPRLLLEEHGAVSEAVVKKMAEGIREKLNTDIGLATSGIAGPDGGTEEKPVGTVWIAYADKNTTIAKKLNLTKDRVLNIQYSSLAALNLFRLNYSTL